MTACQEKCAVVVGEAAGLEIVEEYGSANKAALDNEATEMFFVLRRL